MMGCGHGHPFTIKKKRGVGEVTQAPGQESNLINPYQHQTVKLKRKRSVRQRFPTILVQMRDWQDCCRNGTLRMARQPSGWHLKSLKNTM